MIKKLFILVIITTLTSNYFSQVIVQGYSMMYGGGSYQASNNMPDEEISGASVFYVPINDDVKVGLIWKPTVVMSFCAQAIELRNKPIRIKNCLVIIGF